jgi:hypothetical protein
MGFKPSANIALLNAKEDILFDPGLYDVEAVAFYDEEPGNGRESRS